MLRSGCAFLPAASSRPVDDGVCIDHWLHVRNFALDDSETDQRLHGDFRIALDEDKDILERIEEVAKMRPNFKGIRFAIDAAPQRVRRIVSQMVASEGETRASAQGLPWAAAPRLDLDPLRAAQEFTRTCTGGGTAAPCRCRIDLI